MKLLTKVAQPAHGGDFILINIDREFANWVVEIRDAINKLLKTRPQCPCSWSVFENKDARFLQVRAAQFTQLDQYDSEINSKIFVILPDFLEVPLNNSFTVQIPEREEATDRQDVHGATIMQSVPAHDETKTADLDIQAQRMYITISDEGVSWHACVEPYGRRALSSPRMPLAAINAIAGLSEVHAEIFKPPAE